MPVLALDTSAAVAVAVVDSSGRVLASGFDPEPRKHAELLSPMIVRTLAEAGTDRRELSGVVVGTGPAPFTGLRVGLVTARMLGVALGIPVRGVSSLDALAAQAVVDLALPGGTEVLVATDARRREVFWARYRVPVPSGPSGPAVPAPRVGQRVAPEHAGVPAGTVVPELLDGPGVAAPGDLAADVLSAPSEPGGRGPDPFVVGRGAHLYAQVLTPVPDGPLDPDPAALARLVAARRAAGEVDFPTEPLYLRRPDVTLPGGRKRVTG